jgi:hypothetical protein
MLSLTIDRINQENALLDFYKSYINQYVNKKSNKPFKSGKKFNKVKSVVTHSILKIPAFTFYEDDSIVECRKILVSNC